MAESRWSFEAIGTHWTIDLYQEVSPEAETSLLKLIRQRIELFESTYSRFRKDSWLSKISSTPGTYDLPGDAKPMLHAYERLYLLTDGLMTPLIGQVLSDAGYDSSYSLEPKPMTQPVSWDEALHVDTDQITIKKEVKLDFGAIGKGYLVDILSDLIESQGVTRYCVDAGGDMRHRNIEPLRVGLEDPSDPSRVIGVMNLQNSSLAGSSGNRRAWKKFTHIINPSTLSSETEIAALWVVADTTMIADAMTTALYFCAPEILLAEYDFEYLILRSDRSVEGSLLHSPDLEVY